MVLLIYAFNRICRECLCVYIVLWMERTHTIRCDYEYTKSALQTQTNTHSHTCTRTETILGHFVAVVDRMRLLFWTFAQIDVLLKAAVINFLEPFHVA